MQNKTELVRLTLSLLAIAALTACSGTGEENAPSIPHSITSQTESYCLGCHRNEDNGAPRTPHPDRTGCTGCHDPM